MRNTQFNGYLLSFFVISLFIACTKEPVSEVQQILEPADISWPYPPASIMAADTGNYFFIFSVGNPGSNYPPQIDCAFPRFRIENDTTLFMGGIRLYPLTSDSGMVAKHPVYGYASTGNGYYYGVNGFAEGTYKVAGDKIAFNLDKTFENGQKSTEMRLYYNARPALKPLTRLEYLGSYQGAWTNAYGTGFWLTLTIEPDTTVNGVIIKEINRRGYIDDSGQLVLPQTSHADSLQASFFKETIAMLTGSALVFSTQEVEPVDLVLPGGYKRYMLVKK